MAAGWAKNRTVLLYSHLMRSDHRVRHCVWSGLRRLRVPPFVAWAMAELWGMLVEVYSEEAFKRLNPPERPTLARAHFLICNPTDQSCHHQCSLPLGTTFDHAFRVVLYPNAINATVL